MQDTLERPEAGAPPAGQAGRVENALAAFMMRGVSFVAKPVPEAYRPRRGHYERIAKELRTPHSKRGMLRVVLGMPFQKGAGVGRIDFQAEMDRFEPIEYPNYYRMPYHSIPGGWLNPVSALFNQHAMESIYRSAHPEKSVGIRRAIAELFPKDVRRVVDVGGGTGDGGAALARIAPDAEVEVIEASPAMILVGRRVFGDLRNLSFTHSFAEHTSIADGSVDAVNLSFVTHEVPDGVKRTLLETIFRILRPGGLLVWTDVPPYDLDNYRGLFEPYREQWQRFDPDAALRAVGFASIDRHQVVGADYLWTRVASKRT